jgi:hypothetical protein
MHHGFFCAVCSVCNMGLLPPHHDRIRQNFAQLYLVTRGSRSPHDWQLAGFKDCPSRGSGRGRRSTFAGEFVHFDCDIDFPAIAATNRLECIFLVTSLAQLGVITPPIDASSNDGPDIITEGCLRVTAFGWQKLSASDAPASSGRCFVAMSFDHSMDAAYENGIRPAVEDDARYQACRVDRVHHLEKICDKIVNEIRRSQFVVADVSQHKPGVYFEAGFAMALNRPVIWTCREEDFNLIHFDTRQYNHIKWRAPQDLRQQLADRILATIGERPMN